MSKAREKVIRLYSGHIDKSVPSEGAEQWDLLESISGLVLSPPSFAGFYNYGGKKFSFTFDRYPTRTVVDIMPRYKEITISKSGRENKMEFSVCGTVNDEAKLIVRSLLFEHSEKGKQ